MTNKEAIKILNHCSILPNNRTIKSEDIPLALDLAIKALENERPQGEWIDCRLANGRLGIVCSVCDCEPISDDRGYCFSDFCPSCGAKMREANNEQ